VTILHASSSAEAPDGDDTAQPTDLVETLLWDRKTHGGFPGEFLYVVHTYIHTYIYTPYIYIMTNVYAEVKHLKSLVRNIADPTRSLGHVDRALNKANQEKDKDSHKEHEKEEQSKSKEACEDCQ
jgi:predicted Rdx family selenoprotein